MDGAELLSGRLQYAVSKKALDIEGLGKKIIERFVDVGFVQSLADIYRLHERRAEIEALEGFKEKSVKNIIDEIQERREVSLDRLLVALSIDEVGEETAILLAEEFASLRAIQQASVETLAAVHGIGSVMAEKIRAYFDNQSHQRNIDDLLSEISIIEQKTNVSSGFFSGKTVVVTGTFADYSRDELKALIRKQGGKVASSVSATTDFLLAGEKAGSKLEKARELGVKVIDSLSGID
jgi:DNA ligase (NAD+)